MIILLLALAIVLPIQTVSAMNIHYELDKQYYYPGDAGKLLLSCTNDGPSDLTVLAAEMAIKGIGAFKWEGPAGSLLRRGETLNIEISFTIPADAAPGHYEYTWTVTFGGSTSSKSDTLTVVAVGEEPKSESGQPNPFLFILVAFFALLFAYPLVRVKSKRIARGVIVGIIIVGVLCFLIAGLLFIVLLFQILATLWPVLILLIVVSVAVSVIRKRRKGRKTLGRATFCTQCGKDLSRFPSDIINCPYCGEAVTVQPDEAVPAKTVEVRAELPESVQRIRRYAKRAALLGLLIALASFVLGPFLGGLMGSEHTYMFPFLHEYQNEIGNGAIVGIFIVGVSALVRAVAGVFKGKGR